MTTTKTTIRFSKFDGTAADLGESTILVNGADMGRIWRYTSNYTGHSTDSRVAGYGVELWKSTEDSAPEVADFHIPKGEKPHTTLARARAWVRAQMAS